MNVRDADLTTIFDMVPRIDVLHVYKKIHPSLSRRKCNYFKDHLKNKSRIEPNQDRNQPRTGENDPIDMYIYMTP